MLAELVLFFIPCVVGLINYKSLFIAEGWQLITAIVLGTLCVMVFTAYTVHFALNWNHDSNNAAKIKCYINMS
jgi:holin-like protein